MPARLARDVRWRHRQWLHSIARPCAIVALEGCTVRLRTHYDAACDSGDIGFELCYLLDMPAVLRALAGAEKLDRGCGTATSRRAEQAAVTATPFLHA
jgi:hypothetical protein